MNDGTPRAPGDRGSGTRETRIGRLISRESDRFCGNKALYYLALAVIIAALAVVSYMEARYRCWQWRADPLGAAVLRLRSMGVPVPKVRA